MRRKGRGAGPDPADRGTSGGKHRPLTDGDGVPLASAVTAADVHGGATPPPPLDKSPVLRGRAGRPRTKPVSVTADKACHSAARVTALHARGVWPLLPDRGRGQAAGPGRRRWPVERPAARLEQSRRLRTRRGRRLDPREAFLELACCVICWRKIR